MKVARVDPIRESQVTATLAIGCSLNEDVWHHVQFHVKGTERYCCIEPSHSVGVEATTHLKTNTAEKCNIHFPCKYTAYTIFIGNLLDGVFVFIDYT